LSCLVLMVRGLDLRLRYHIMLCSFEGSALDGLVEGREKLLTSLKPLEFPSETPGLSEPKEFLGGDSEGETPVPIPNTAVKPFSGDGTATSRGGRVARCQDLIYSCAMLLVFPVSHWRTLLGSSMAEHSAVNRRVAGSSPARGAIFLTPEGVFFCAK
jgi:hypothetical protein